MKVFMVVCIFFVTTMVSSDCLIRVKVHKLAPIAYIAEDGSWTGSSVEMSKALIEEAGCTAEYVEVSMTRGLHLMKLGRLEMATDLSYNIERADYIHYLGKQRQERVVLVVDHLSQYQVDSIEDFKLLPNPIGVILGFYYGEEIKSKLLKDRAFKEKLVPLASLDQLMNALKHKRISAFLLDSDNAKKLMSKAFVDYQFKIHQFVVYDNPVYFGVSKGAVTPNLYEKLQYAYYDLNSSGFFESILKKYQ